MSEFRATYTKLRKTGGWGIRVQGEGHDSLSAGDEVTVTKKSGETDTKKVALKIASYPEDGASIYAIDKEWF